MSPRRAAFVALLAFAGAVSGLAREDLEPEALPLRGDLSPIHDPSIIRHGST